MRLLRFVKLALITLIQSCCVFEVLAQNFFSVSSRQQITVVLPTKTICASIDTKSRPKVHDDWVYLWYDNNNIHQTTGGYSGHILHGNYKEFYYPSNDIAVAGYIRNGVKQGQWRYWFPNGNIREIVTWEHGKMSRTRYCFYENGKPLSEESYSYGLLNGKKITYDTLGNVITKQYEDGFLLVKNNEDTLVANGNNQKPMQVGPQNQKPSSSVAVKNSLKEQKLKVDPNVNKKSKDTGRRKNVLGIFKR